MSDIRRGMCFGCPWDIDSEATEMAYNYGCLPSIGEATELAHADGMAWACHEEPNKMCCGYAADNKANIGRDLYRDGTHGLEYMK